MGIRHNYSIKQFYWYQNILDINYVILIFRYFYERQIFPHFIWPSMHKLDIIYVILTFRYFYERWIFPHFLLPSMQVRYKLCDTYFSIFLRTSDISTFPLTINAQAKYKLCLGSAFINWWSLENESENIWSSLSK